MRRLAFLSLMLLPLAVPAQDFALGTTRSAGMGNAGLALRGTSFDMRPRNPALYAYQNSFRVSDFSFGQFTDGANFGDFGRFFGGLGSGGLDYNDLVNIARDFGDDKVDVGATLGFAAGGNGFNFAVDANALVTTRPNAQLQQWVNAGSDENNTVAGMRLDGYGYGQAQIALGYGRFVNTGVEGHTAVGANVRFIQAYYTHHRINENNVGNPNGPDTGAPELNGSDYLRRNGVAVDLGVHHQNGQLAYAMVIQNLVAPAVGFSAITPGSDLNGRSGIDPNARSVSFGMALQQREDLAFAADVVNIGNGQTEFRFGGDLMFNRSFGARAGYSTRDGWTVGGTVGGFNLALGSANAIRAGYFFRF
ncbi:MAG: conjugal transfer protein TraF [Fimbriimonadaceae bacterium]|nr:conjugal transfer protein TraF [Fimbriimonadaceae bacterium]